ncbi:MAG: hypothetical protein FJ104_12430 [Deltaproteobacteria bacterium]|nr:hypothetical protein [Deltaproteobacteria bacterium]
MTAPSVDADALLCALILAPRTFSRNRHFDLFESATLARVRRRASRVRGIIRQLSQPGGGRAEITGEQVLADGRVLLRFRVPALSLSRTTALSPLEAATLRYALHRAGLGPLSPLDRSLVEQACARLGLGVEGLSAGVSAEGR